MADETIDVQLTKYRSSIDNIDAALVHLLAERFKITQDVGRYKAAAGFAVETLNAAPRTLPEGATLTLRP